jgi:uncharacterized phosphosugar-binding protein
MVTASEMYLAELGRILDRIRTEQRDAIAKAAAVVARAIAARGIVHVFGCGHSHLLAEEMFYRAGGLAAVNPILDDRLTFVRGVLASTRAEREPGLAAALLAGEDVRPADAGIIVSNSGRNAAPIEMAGEFRRRAVPTIAITNVAQSRASASRHESGLRLFELADVVVDTCVPLGDAVVAGDALPAPMGPASTVAGAAIVHAIAIEAAATLKADGQQAPVLPSANVDGTSEQTLETILRPYRGRVRYLDVD